MNCYHSQPLLLYKGSRNQNPFYSFNTSKISSFYHNFIPVILKRTTHELLITTFQLYLIIGSVNFTKILNWFLQGFKWFVHFVTPSPFRIDEQKNFHYTKSTHELPKCIQLNISSEVIVSPTE